MDEVQVGDTSSSAWLSRWAARNGKLEVLKWCEKHHFLDEESRDNGDLAALAAMSGSVETIKGLHGMGAYVGRRACLYAARGSNYELFQAARWIGAEFDVDSLNAAAEAGCVEIMEFIYKWNVLGNRATFAAAARGGYQTTLKWLKAKGCIYDESAISEAAATGDIRTLDWLYEEKFPMDATAMARAAKNGHMAALSWLQNRRCPWDERSPQAAVYLKDSGILQSLLLGGCPVTDETIKEARRKWPRVEWSDIVREGRAMSTYRPF